MTAGSPALTTQPLRFSVTTGTFTKNSFAGTSMVVSLSNGVAVFRNCTFNENYSTGRGSLATSDFTGAKISFINCTMDKNYAFQGGVFYSQLGSTVILDTCTVTNNFAGQGGVGLVSSGGFASFTNCNVSGNWALNSPVLYVINTAIEVAFSGGKITQNGYAQHVVSKSFLLMKISEGFGFMHFE